jgi:hypothetical protein
MHLLLAPNSQAVARPAGSHSRPTSVAEQRCTWVSIELSERAFDDPSAWQQLKASSVSGALDDFDGPLAEFDEGVTQVGPS